MNAKDPKPRFQSSAPDYIQDKTDKTISFTDFKVFFNNIILRYIATWIKYKWITFHSVKYFKQA